MVLKILIKNLIGLSVLLNNQAALMFYEKQGVIHIYHVLRAH